MSTFSPGVCIDIVNVYPAVETDASANIPLSLTSLSSCKIAKWGAVSTVTYKNYPSLQQQFQMGTPSPSHSCDHADLQASVPCWKEDHLHWIPVTGNWKIPAQNCVFYLLQELLEL